MWFAVSVCLLDLVFVGWYNIGLGLVVVFWFRWLHCWLCVFELLSWVCLLLGGFLFAAALATWVLIIMIGWCGTVLVWIACRGFRMFWFGVVWMIYLSSECVGCGLMVGHASGCKVVLLFAAGFVFGVFRFAPTGYLGSGVLCFLWVVMT